MTTRLPLNRTRIVSAAVAVADTSGLSAVSMRSVARELAVEAMSLYHHMQGKDDLLDALADHAFTLIPPPTPTDDWRQAMADRAHAARAAFGAHPWALSLVESRRKPGPGLLRHHDATLGCLRAGGFSTAEAAHAFSVLDAYVYGFVLTESTLPFEAGESAGDFAAGLDIAASEYPHLIEMMAELVTGQNYDYGDEFVVGLDLILDGLERRRG